MKIFADAGYHFPALPPVNWRGCLAPRGQWERSGAESSGRLYYSVVLLPTVDASPAQPVAPQHPPVHGLYSFPPSATSAHRVPDTLLPGLQCGVTGTCIFTSHLPVQSSSCFFFPLFFSTDHAERRACLQRRECDFMEMLCCRGKAWLSCCMLIFYFYFFCPHRHSFLLRTAAASGSRSGLQPVRCGAHVAAKVKRIASPAEAGLGSETGRACWWRGPDASFFLCK